MVPNSQLADVKKVKINFIIPEGQFIGAASSVGKTQIRWWTCHMMLFRSSAVIWMIIFLSIGVHLSETWAERSYKLMEAAIFHKETELKCYHTFLPSLPILVIYDLRPSATQIKEVKSNTL